MLLVADGIQDRTVDITPVVRGTDYRNVQKAIAKGATVAAVPLPGFGGLLDAPTQPRTRLLKEFSDRIRVIRRRPTGRDWEVKLEPPVNKVFPVSRSALSRLWTGFEASE